MAGMCCPAYNGLRYGKKLQSQEKTGIVRASKTDAVFDRPVGVHRLRVYLHGVLVCEPAGVSHSLVLADCQTFRSGTTCAGQPLAHSHHFSFPARPEQLVRSADRIKSFQPQMGTDFHKCFLSAFHLCPSLADNCLKKDSCRLLWLFRRKGRYWLRLLDSLFLSRHGNPQVNLFQ
jgi:hypothetical protein